MKLSIITLATIALTACGGSSDSNDSSNIGSIPTVAGVYSYTRPSYDVECLGGAVTDTIPPSTLSASVEQNEGALTVWFGSKQYTGTLAVGGGFSIQNVSNTDSGTITSNITGAFSGASWSGEFNDSAVGPLVSCESDGTFSGVQTG